MPSHLIRCLIYRYLAGRSIDLMSDEVLRKVPTADSLVTETQQALVKLREEAEALAADADIAMIDLSAHAASAEADGVSLITPSDLLPRLLSLGCLQLWPACRMVLERAVHGVASMLAAAGLPHELPSSTCDTLALAVSALVAGYKLLLAERGMEPEDNLRMRIILLIQRAEYALCCSLRDFEQVHSLLEHGARGAIADGAWKPKAPSARPKWRRGVKSDEERYVWARFHLCALHHLRRGDGTPPPSRPPQTPPASATPGGKGLKTPPPPPLRMDQLGSTGVVPAGRGATAEEALLFRWMALLRISSRAAASQIKEEAFPLDPTSALLAAPPARQGARLDVG